MKSRPWILLLGALLAYGRSETPATAVAAANVNSRYTVEHVELEESYWRKLSGALQRELLQLIGRKYDQAEVERLRRRMRQELHGATIRPRLSRGHQPDHVRLAFEVRRPYLERDAEVTKIAYHSRQGWTGGIESGFTIRQVRVGFGVQSDGNELIERYAGWNVRASRIFAERLRLRVDLESFHQQWNQTTLEALPQRRMIPPLYRARQNIQPGVTVALGGGVTTTVGVTLQHLEMQEPPAVTQASHAAFANLEVQREWEMLDADHSIQAAYGVRAATRTLGTDCVYNRHVWQVRYRVTSHPYEVSLQFYAGAVRGQAPLFDRFVLGNASRLRGWSKWDVAPLGAERVVYGSAQFRRSFFVAYYDVGSLGTQSELGDTRHAAGFGIRGQGLFIGLGFPLNAKRTAPVFLISTNF